MNGFKVLAVGAFLYCGPSFCFAQVNSSASPARPRTILVKAVQEDAIQPAAEAELKRSGTVNGEITSNDIGNPFLGANQSPSDLVIDAHEAHAADNDPASLPPGIGQRHNPIDQILTNGLILQTPNSAQVPVAWPMQGPFNPTAHMMMNTGCTQGLWDNYPAERAAECALMYQRLAGHQHCHSCAKQGCASGCKSCGHAGCGTSACGSAHFKPINRYAPAVCDASHVAPAAHRAAQPQFQSLVAPTPTLAEPLADEAPSKDSEDKDSVAQLPGLFR
ncbi:MAG: hypothetical protein SFV81_21800 [Pirellulaceae bacterium]|nr:hypothetical protein [Pirellulaceae bacterium]